jgi:hypothetical protein
LGFATGALPGAGLLSAFFLPNIEKTTKELPGFRGIKANWACITLRGTAQRADCAWSD